MTLSAINLQGGWEMDESMEEAAMRETLEEVGVIGSVEVSVSSNIIILSQVYMFELLPLFFKLKFNFLNDIYGFFSVNWVNGYT